MLVVISQYLKESCRLDGILALVQQDLGPRIAGLTPRQTIIRRIRVGSGKSKESTPKGGGFGLPLKGAEFLALVFFEPLILFLIFYVAPYLVLVQTYRAYTIPAAPEMITPVRPTLQRRVALENLYRRLALQYAHHFRNRVLWRYAYHSVHMVFPHAQLQYFYRFPLAQRSDCFFDKLCYSTLQYPEPVFRAPHDMIAALVHHMSQLLPFRHIFMVP